LTPGGSDSAFLFAAAAVVVDFFLADGAPGAAFALQ
jgi:hypothetical protein